MCKEHLVKSMKQPALSKWTVRGVVKGDRLGRGLLYDYTLGRSLAGGGATAIKYGRGGLVAPVARAY